MDTETVELVSYLALGVLFAFVASFALRREGWRGIALVTVSAVVLMLGIGIWLENKSPDSETAIGLPILIALLSPALSAAFVWAPAQRGWSVSLQCVMGTVGWAAAAFITVFAAFFLNWITF